MKPRISIFSLTHDLHALAAASRIRERGADCFMVATDTPGANAHFSWSSDANQTLVGSDRGLVQISSLDVIWWRRVNQPLLGTGDMPPDVSAFVNNEWRAALFGGVSSAFAGRWVNDPACDALAGNKIYQLPAASAVGLRVPRTLVSQVPDEIRDFCASVGSKVVAKKLVGAGNRPLATVALSSTDLTDDEGMRLCPAIYQEVIPARHHLRVCCFGERVLAVQIDAELLDWRRDLTVPFTPTTLDAETELSLVRLTERLGLRMSIMDLIRDDTGNLVWLELNTQGQFLFAEALSGVDLLGPFVDFLIAEASRRPAPQLAR